ncbi:hypothetical protein FMEXI_12231 [Fusarium mexicanum]|uniref:Uncharacterized protein n=1 Tax=Fusarium mexicanum TaxID=751941 RepID=A0A8H5IBG9_9HYPO|nr:hypothetical protein FMEXI_12231 [Fusarium mexicanum]
MSTSLIWNNQNGTLTINRDNLRDFYAQSVQNYIPSVCFQVQAHCDVHDMFNVAMSADISPGGQPNLSEVSGETVLSYSYSDQSHDGAGINDNMSSLTIGTNYNMDIQFTNAAGNASVVITQHLVINYDMKMLETASSGNAVDKTIVDTYTLTIDESGTLSVGADPVITDNSTAPEEGFQDFFNGSGGFIRELRTGGDSLQPTSVLNIPLSFYGGQTFTLSSVQFSDSQDLVASVA